MATQPSFPITLKLTVVEFQVLDDLVHANNYASRSAAIRHGLGLLFDHWNISSILDRALEADRKQHKPRANGKIRHAQLRAITNKPSKKK